MPSIDPVKLAEAMNWVIPPDSSPGAGSPEGLARMIAFIDRQGLADLYTAHMEGLVEADLSNPSNAFAQLFVEQVKDVYYGYPDTGSWADIGFIVNDP